MILCAAGDVHGKIHLLYENIRRFEAHLGVTFAGVLQVGDLGIWPYADRVDRATRNHGGAGDFPEMWSSFEPVPLTTVFIKGNHEDFEFLGESERFPHRPMLPNLYYLPNGQVSDYVFGGGRGRVGGVGGCYAFSSDDDPEESDRASPYCYRSSEIDSLRDRAGINGIDVLLLHDAPDGIRVGEGGSSYDTRGPGLRRLVAEASPKICFFGHHHAALRATISGVTTIGLNLVGRPGHLAAWDTDEGLLGLSP